METWNFSFYRYSHRESQWFFAHFDFWKERSCQSRVSRKVRSNAIFSFQNSICLIILTIPLPQVNITLELRERSESGGGGSRRSQVTVTFTLLIALLGQLSRTFLPHWREFFISFSSTRNWSSPSMGEEEGGLDENQELKCFFLCVWGRGASFRTFLGL